MNPTLTDFMPGTGGASLPKTSLSERTPGGPGDELLRAPDSGVPGYTFEAAPRGRPAILAFASGGEWGPAHRHAGLLRRIAARRAGGASLVVLHDPANAGFYRGVPGLGTTIAEVAASLGRLIAGLEPSELFSFGAGIGGHAALVFGVLLGAARIVAAEPAAHLIDDLLYLYHDRRWQHTLNALPDPTTARRYDVPALMTRTRYAGRAFILYGTGRDNDLEDVHLNTVHAQWIARSDRVTLCPFPQFRAEVLDGLLAHGLADDVLARCFFEPPPAPPAVVPVHVNLGPLPVFRVRRAVERGEVVTHVATEEPAASWDASTTTRDAPQRHAWIAQRLLLGTGVDELRQALAAAGVPDPQATREIDQALASPYFRGCRRAQARLEKRDWLLAVYRKLNRLHPASAEVPRRHKLPRQEFLELYYSTNRPVIITGMMDDWPVLREWSIDYLDGRVPTAGLYWRGPAGTISPLHHGLTSKFLAQVAGRKRVKLSPSWDIPLTIEDSHIGARDPARTASPPGNSSLDQPQILDCILNPGEILFVPVGWLHGIERIDATVTLVFRGSGLRDRLIDHGTQALGRAQRGPPDASASPWPWGGPGPAPPPAPPPPGRGGPGRPPPHPALAAIRASGCWLAFTEVFRSPLVSVQSVVIIERSPAMAGPDKPVGRRDPPRANPSRWGKLVATLLADDRNALQAHAHGPSARESARVWLWRTLFTSLCGVTFGDWVRILRDNRFRVDLPYWPQAALLTLGSPLNSLYLRKENKAFGARLSAVQVHPPLFILGHWRSGTTLLHNLLALDSRFAYPNLYEVFFPHTFLCTESYRADQIAGLVPATRLIDSMAQGLSMPNEDEFATCATALCSPYMLWAFPRSTARYERYLTFRGVPAADVARWKEAFLRFLKKLTLHDDRPMLLKSPPHTGRIKLLLGLFPEARFLHIRREPYTVFQSTRHLNGVLTRSLQFQKPDPADADAAVLRRYRLLYDAYFEERPFIPAGQLHEVAFEELEADPTGVMRQTYAALGLPGFATLLPRLEEYVATLAGYRKNTYPELPAELRTEIAREWGRCFEEWGYPTS